MVVGCGVDATVKLGVRVLSINVDEVGEGYKVYVERRDNKWRWRWVRNEKQTRCKCDSNIDRWGEYIK